MIPRFIYNIDYTPPSLSSMSSSQIDEDFNETDLFPAVRVNDVEKIENYIKNNGDINALDTCKRNALQATLQQGICKVRACVTLIKNGINLENNDDANETAMATIVYFYKCSSGIALNSDRLEIFRYMVEAGANLNVKKKFLGEEPTDIRKRIRSFPELEAIVKEVNAKRANHVYTALRGDIQVSRLVCQMLDSYAFTD